MSRGKIRPEPGESRATFFARLIKTAKPLSEADRDRIGTLLRHQAPAQGGTLILISVPRTCLRGSVPPILGPPGLLRNGPR